LGTIVNPLKRRKAEEMVPQNTPMKEDDAAAFIGMSVSYLRLSRMRGATKCTDAPPFVRIGKAIRYLPRDLDAWLESRRRFPGRAV
jgi:predicted DNA-binding transcriptional regulator AlpA